MSGCALNPIQSQDPFASVDHHQSVLLYPQHEAEEAVGRERV